MTIYEPNTSEETYNKIRTTPRVLVMVSTKWCIQCHNFTQYYEKASNKLSSFLFLKVDYDKCPEMYKENKNVEKVPTFILYIDGIETKRFHSYVKTNLDKLVKDYTA
ncbi:hypothetical protein DICPUDRAFT_92090 [Dictyostelium purpureum]|uniref:Thioredoxin domain-containing protein n=1 Tax=Dictyostelium purpureum TaxID=5786 RepID=F0ZLW1_DICPU|nr:uncharacterized protein DICPUDRAFT_92090 [Dictyostelium purpureum]EGC35037.1 hypothetical protein DICPUDRAFT_92090 [Dictyostelium purpureum]|eukprot:XP_003288405.1 hypothetical protein DICPUDRAFT_92090 [Dictyostelium purpureum]